MKWIKRAESSYTTCQNWCTIFQKYVDNLISWSQSFNHELQSYVLTYARETDSEFKLNLIIKIIYRCVCIDSLLFYKDKYIIFNRFMT